MRARRLACFFFGIWLAGSLLVALVPAANLKEVDRLLSHSDPAATFRLHEAGANAPALLRRQAAEFNRRLTHSWENTQLCFGFAFLAILLFWSHENKLVLGGVFLLLVLTALQRFLFDAEIAALGRMLDFEAGANAGERTQLWIAQSADRGVEIAKAIVMLLLTGRLVFSRERSGRSRDSRREFDRIDIRDHRRVNG